MPAAALDSARDRVHRRLVQRARCFPDLDLGSLDTAGLSDADTSLALAIDHAVARRWLSLRALIESRLDRPWERVQPELQAVFLAGAAQLYFLDRVPDHAAVSESVAWAKAHVRTRAGGFVNAVLRRLIDLRGDAVDRFDPERDDELPLANGRAWRLREAIFPADATARLARQTSHPVTLLAHWVNTIGFDRARDLALHDLVLPPIIVADAPPGRPDLTPHERPGFAVFTGDRRDLAELLESSPGARVQDPASAQPVLLTGALRPEVVVDACAGLGTKTRQLRALHPDATIVASDVNEARLKVLRASFRDDERVKVVGFKELDRWREKADLLVLDVPCSNTAVLPRRPEAKYRFDRARQEGVVELQRQIVADTLPLLAPTGHLLYATCSLEPEENERQAAWLRRWHRMEPVAERRETPRGLPGDPPTRYQDGGYACLLRRTVAPGEVLPDTARPA